MCAVGAVVAYQEAQKSQKTVTDLFAEWGDDQQGYDDDEWETVWAGERAGLPTTLAWILMEMNDETCADYTPAERYTTILNWVRDRKHAAMERHHVHS